MKPLRFLGDSRKALREFPGDARRDAGRQLWKVQNGNAPDDYKPLNDIGEGVEEIRVREGSGTFRVIYVAKMPEAVYVLHAFQKKTQKTSKRDIETVKLRLKRLIRGES